MQFRLGTSQATLIVYLCTAPLFGLTQAPANKPNASISAANPVSPAPNLPDPYTGNLRLNKITVRSALGPFVLENDFLGQTYLHVQETNQYYDGLGRPLQTVIRQSTSETEPKDLVQPFTYDRAGREEYKYLPYASTNADGKFKLNPLGEQATFSTGQFPGESIYFSRTVFESSPLNRITKSFAPGNSWAGSIVASGSDANERAIKAQYGANSVDDDIRIWTISNNPLSYDGDNLTNIPVSNTGIYGEGVLFKTVIKDENGNLTIEFKDKNGLLILKKVQVAALTNGDAGYDHFLCTYYIYDDFNHLRFVIPPKAVDLLRPGWELTTTIVSELCFRYEYDLKNRLIAKKIPGAGWTYMVYDERDRLIYTQDANLRQTHNWLATLYDDLNRPVLTGIIEYSEDRGELQDDVDAGFNNPSQVVEVHQQQIYNLLVAQRIETITLYEASNEIAFVDEFASEDAGEYVAQISSGFQSTQTIIANGSIEDLNENLVTLTTTVYDTYSSSDVGYSDEFNGHLVSGINVHANNQISNADQLKVQTRGKITKSSVRVLEDPTNIDIGTWLSSISYYDHKGQLIQNRSNNYKGGIDIVTNRYNFTGTVISSYLKHENPTSTYGNVQLCTDYQYDHTGRLLEIGKVYQISGVFSNKRTVVAKNEYDKLGNLKRKELGRTVTYEPNNEIATDPIETLDFTYNIRGWLQGINKDYAALNGTSNRWFGMELNYDWGFTNAQFNGNISGVKWRSKGDLERRAFGYGYDFTKRFLSADFSQYSAESTAYSDNSNMNFDVVMGNGSDPASAYDANGNIKAMKQWGLKLSASVVIDDLSYLYFDNSNKLKQVKDIAINDPNAMLGDFRTSPLHVQNKDANTTDYLYDPNGNLNKDLNKDIGTELLDGIKYNHLNLPWQITFQKAGGEKGVITYIFDALGNKLEKRVLEYTQPQQTEDKTTYIAGIVYEDNQPQFMLHEEGRIRLRTYTHTTATFYPCDPPVGMPNYCEGHVYVRYTQKHGTTPIYDYFVKDHLGNVRMVLTEEQKQDIYPAATLEGNILLSGNPNAINIEKDYYSINTDFITTKPWTTETLDYRNKNGGNGQNDPPVNNNPSSASTQVSEKVYKMNAVINKIGLGISLKVMAGDQINIFAKSYWSTSGGNYSDKVQIPVSMVLDAFIGSPSMVGKGLTTTLWNNTPFADLFNHFNTRDDNPGLSAPWAYINWIFFDEHFNFVESGSGFDRIGVSSSIKSHSTSTIAVPKNGYVFVYCSNQSNYDVFFDNLQVIHTRGPLLEETHYYPFGLIMSGISSKALAFGEPKNSNKFITEQLDDDLGLNWYQLKYRNYDPQIGRFIQIDPISYAYTHNSTYAYAENKVINGIDAEGLEYVTRIYSQDAEGKWAKKDIIYYQMSERQIKALKGTPASSYNAASYGPEGKGVKHEYNYFDGRREVAWDNKRENLSTKVGNHGLYSGPGCITDFNGNYDFDFQPVDWADAIAQRHDEDYAAATATGEKYAGYVDDIRTYQADVDMLERIDDIISDMQNPFKPNVVRGVRGPYRTNSSTEMGIALAGQKIVISALAKYKKWKIDNGYSNEDKFEDLKERYEKHDKINAAIINAVKGG